MQYSKPYVFSYFLKMEAVISSLMSVKFTKLHGVTIQDTLLFIITVATTSICVFACISRKIWSFILQQSLYRPGEVCTEIAAERGYRRLRHPEYLYGRQVKVTGLSALSTGRLYPQEVPLLLISIRDCVDRKDLVKEMLQSFRLMSQCLSQMRDHFILKEDQRFRMDDNLVL